VLVKGTKKGGGGGEGGGGWDRIILLSTEVCKTKASAYLRDIKVHS